MELAAPDTRVVPTEQSRNVDNSNGAGAIAYPAIVVSTTKAAKRNHIIPNQLNGKSNHLQVNRIFDNIM